MSEMMTASLRGDCNGWWMLRTQRSPSIAVCAQWRCRHFGHFNRSFYLLTYLLIIHADSWTFYVYLSDWQAGHVISMTRDLSCSAQSITVVVRESIINRAARLIIDRRARTGWRDRFVCLIRSLHDPASACSPQWLIDAEASGPENNAECRKAVPENQCQLPRPRFFTTS